MILLPPASAPVGKSSSLCKLCGSRCLCGGIAKEDAHHRGTEIAQRTTERNSPTDSFAGWEIIFNLIRWSRCALTTGYNLSRLRREDDSAASEHEEKYRSYSTARSVISKPLSMIAKASRISASVIHSGGLVKKVFQRTKV